MDSKDCKDISKNKEIGKYLNLGFQLAVAVGLGIVVGYWLDKKLGTVPLFLLLGLSVGAVAGFLNIYRIVYPPQNSKSVLEKQRNEINS